MKFLPELLLLVLSLMFTNAEKLPPGIKRCKQNDSSCLKNSIQQSLVILKDGFPEIDLPPLDPLKLSKLTIGEGNIVQLVQNYENMEVFGLSNAKLTDATFDMDKKRVIVHANVPMIQMNSSYVVKGKVLMLDVHGKGSSFIGLEHLDAEYILDMEIITKNNDKYLKATKSVMSIKCQHAAYNFDNLFDGNKMLGDNINKVLNDNWQQILEDLLPAYSTSIALSLTNHINKIFLKIPMKDLFLD